MLMEGDVPKPARNRGAVGERHPHDSGRLHVSGRAWYTDDIPEPRRLLHAAVGMSVRAHARIRSADLEPVRHCPGVVAVYTAADIPGENNFGPVVHDDPILAAETVTYAGQAMFVVVARTVDQARRAARRAQIEYQDLEPVLDLDEALRRKSFVLPSQSIRRGDTDGALARAGHRLNGRLELGGQDQFYLEGQIAMAVPKEDGDMYVYSSTQHPGEVQHRVAGALGRQAKDVVVECRRMGGAFGGKESQAAQMACIAALAAQKTGRAVKFRMDRDADMIMTGKRHDFVIYYDVGFDDDGVVAGVRFELLSRCGVSVDLSGAVNDRTMFHCDNAYYFENMDVISHRCRTNTVSNTAFRGFGGPQGMFAVEYVLDEIAGYLARDPLEIRRANFYGIDERNVTHYGQVIEDNIIHPMVRDLEASSDYRSRRAAIREFNASHQVLKKGIALTPVKFGISFTATHLNQAGALLSIYTDGTVHLNHGGTEMGQGLFTKVAQVVAEELQIDIDRIKITASDTSKVPNASATAASSGSDLNGKAAQAAARTIKQRLVKFACSHYKVAAAEVCFQDNHVMVGEQRFGFTDFVRAAWMARVSLSSTGFYRTPKIHYDKETFTGRPFLYYAYGAAVSEAIIDTLSGEYRVTRVDILHDCGKSLNPAIDLGQVEGGFIQGMGWLTSEELWWNEAGELKTHAPSTYKIPTCSDLPADFRVRLLESAANREETIHRSKAVGEPPLMLALSVFFAIRDAVAAVADHRRRPRLDAPATPERVLTAVERQRGRAASMPRSEPASTFATASAGSPVAASAGNGAVDPSGIATTAPVKPSTGDVLND